jgi:hypothetical protein
VDPYIVSLALGAVGLGAMAVSGLGSHGHAGHGSHGHGGHLGDAGHGHAGHAHGGHAPVVHGHHAGDAHAHHDTGSGKLFALMSPRTLFSLFLGFGTAGLLLRPVLGGVTLALASILGGIIFERFIVSPLWNFTMRFASRPATTLESAVADEATAVTAFDANGQGIVSLEVDGHVVQILATLQANDRLLASRVRAGQRLRIEAVDEIKNCCTVSVL